MSLPKLPIPNKNEVYMQFVDTEYNCLSCPKGKYGVQTSLTSHITWLYQSISALGKDDIFLVGGDFWFFDQDQNNSYYKGGFMQAVVDAMNRGAKVVTLIGYGYVGDYEDCTDKKYNGIYQDWACKPTKQNYDYLLAHGNGNYYNYGIKSFNGTTSHCKLISFYIKTQNLVSTFMGSWNLNTNVNGSNMKETGVGFITTLDSDFGQTALLKDLNILKIFESDPSNIISLKISNLLTMWAISENPPSQPIIVPTVYFSGPNFCDKNFGCAASGDRTSFNDRSCLDNESFIVTIDKNVHFSFGVDPNPKNSNPNIPWNTNFLYGGDLLIQLIKNAKKYIKNIVHSECLENDSVSSFGDPFSLILPEFKNEIYNSLNNGINWFCLQNNGWENSNSNSFISQIKSDPNKWKNMYPKIYGVCGRINESYCPIPDTNPVQYTECSPDQQENGINNQLTHDKMWLSDNSILLSSAHPCIGQYSDRLLNEDLLIENCPSILNYFNNHINQLWYKCGMYATGTQFDPNQNKYYGNLGDMTCTSSSDNKGGCCISSNMKIVVKDLINDPYFSKNCKDCGDGDCCINNCCDTTCCDNDKKNCCDSNCTFCCDKNQTCCNKNKCCGKEGCCGDKCCEEEDLCKNTEQSCGDKCCPIDTDICGNGTYCPKGTNCCGGKCCPKDQTCCGDSCCKNQIMNDTIKINNPLKIGLLILFIISICISIYFFINKRYKIMYITISLTIISLMSYIIYKPTKIEQKNIINKNVPISPIEGKNKSSLNKVNGLLNSGLCKGPKDSYPYYQSLSIDNLNECKEKCINDSNCLGLNFNDGSCEECKDYSCQLFSNTKTGNYINGPSKNWNVKNEFPMYSSPYQCPDSINKLVCDYNNNGNDIKIPAYPDSPEFINSDENTIVTSRSAYPELCTESPGWSCYSKKDLNNLKDIKSIDVGSTDSSGCAIVISDPYLNTNELLNTENNFYNWYLNLLNNSNKFIILANAYIKLGMHNSEDPTDYQNQIFYAFKNALDRGVKIYCVSIIDDMTECTTKSGLSTFANQPGLIEYIDKNFIYTHFRSNEINFFHDKIYISENKAYIGGQNLSGTSSIDIGITVNSLSPMYSDILEKAIHLVANTNYELNFTYTKNNPFISDTGSQYFIAVSPYNPICKNLQDYNHCEFQQTTCPTPLNSVGPYFIGDWSNPSGNVSYEWHHVRDIIENATKFLFITNFDFSIYGDYFAEHNGYDKTLIDGIVDAANRNVNIDLWIHNMPISDGLCWGNTTCNMFRCPETANIFDSVKDKENCKIHYWYENPMGSSGFNDICKTLHAKIYYSDYGILITSTNFTPSYFGGTYGTGLAVKFGDIIPDWLKGIEVIKNILESQGKGDVKCDNKIPNFQKVSGDGKYTCLAGSQNCTNTCIRPSETSNKFAFNCIK